VTSPGSWTGSTAQGWSSDLVQAGADAIARLRVVENESGVTVEEFLSRLDRVKKAGTGWVARCPAHEDRTPSLGVSEGDDGRVLVVCHAGCTVDAILVALGLGIRDLFPEGGGGEGASRRTRRQAVQAVQVRPRLVTVDGERVDRADGLTVEQLAEAKRLPVELLTGLGCETVRYFGPPAVQVPYSDERGDILAVRYRLALSGETKHRWRKGATASTLLYGAGRLHKARELGYVVIVEGETDAWTLLHHGHPVVGLPGAGMWSDEEHAARLDGIETVYVVVEPDRGGQTLLGDLRASVIQPRVRIITLPAKDVSDLHLSDEAGFAAAFATAMENSTTLLAVEEERRRELAAAAWEQCEALALKRNILTAFAAQLRARGFVGPLKTPKLIYLVLVSRLLGRPVSLVLRGLSSAGKSYNVESVLPFFPASGYFDRSGMSERALVYSAECFAHRILYIAEAEAVAGEGLGAYFLRTLISENRLVYEVVEKDGDRLVTRVITKPGPTGVILTTTRLRLHPENESRMLALTVPDDRELTREIIKAIARRDDDEADKAPPEQWRSLQTWLELGAERRVIAENRFLLTLAELIPVVAVRLRRDFALVRSLIFAHAILHQASRDRDDRGRIIATLDDYAAVRELIGGIVSEGIGATVSNDVRELVAAVTAALAKTGSDTDTVRRTQVEAELDLDPRAVRRRLAQAVEGGFVVNRNPGRGKTALYAIGDPIPDDVNILPTVDTIRQALNQKNLDNLATDPRDTPPLTSQEHSPGRFCDECDDPGRCSTTHRCAALDLQAAEWAALNGAGGEP
jgi:hypothetical protein